ncbi:MAG: phosphotransferase [Anaerolineales bacterium]|nr:phosphotransferase [Anaerolineales bacterium]
MDDLLRSWNIGRITEVKPIDSYWGKARLVKTVDGHCFILKEKLDLSQSEQESSLLSSLAEVGAPVAVPVRTVDAMWYASNDHKIFCLYPRLTGKIVADHYAGNATARAQALGRAIGFLHTCFLKCDGLSGYKDMQLMQQIRDWAIPHIQEHETIVDADRIEKIWRAAEEEMGPLYAELPRQLIHRDLHPANILFDSSRLTGFVDFEMVMRGPRIFDVCYCGTSLLVSGFPDKIQMWPALFQSLVDGYQGVCPLTSSELLATYGTLVAIEILFAAFSLETQDEGAARCNVSVLNWLSANRELIFA